MTRLWGRDAEQARLTEFVRAACAGEGGSLVLRGEAGIGKSALLEAAAAAAHQQGMTVLAAHGSSAETRLPFGALHQMLWPLLRERELMPGSTDSLRAVLGTVGAAAPDPYGVAFATLDLLVASGRRGPLLMVADDVHWFDRPTADVLGFVARRLRNEPLALLGALREGSGNPFAAHGLPELAIGPLAEGPSRALLEQHGADLSLRMRDHLMQAARGNPLALRELPLAVRQQDENEHSLRRAMPLNARLERSFAARLPDMPAPTRTALLALAADTHCTLAQILAVTTAVLGTSVPLTTIEPALAAGLVDSDGTSLSFRHPLIASAVYQSATLSDRIAVHHAFAGILAQDPDRSVWHKAAAALGPDRQLTAELTDFAERAATRGAASTAVEALERAAALTPDSGERTTRLLRAALFACEIPHGKPKAAALLDSVRLDHLDTRNEAVRSLVEEQAGLHPGEDNRFVRTLVRSALAVHEAGDTALAHHMLSIAALRCWMHGADTGLRRWFADVLNTLDPTLRSPSIAYTLTYLLPHERGRAILERLDELRDAGDDDATHYAIAVQGLLGEYPAVVAGIAAEISAARAQGKVVMAAKFLSVWAGSDIWVGAWDRAIESSLQCERLALTTDEPVWRLMALGHRAGVAALRGQTEHAQALATEILTARDAPRYLRSVAHRVLGINALNAGKGADAFEHLVRLFDPADPVHHYALAPFATGDLADAALAAGRVAEARTIVARLMPLVARSGAAAVTICMNHAQAVLATDDDAEAAWATALATDLAEWPYHRGRIHLAYGQWLRRRRRPTESRSHLQLALGLLEPLGADHWADQARRELRAAGQPSPNHAPDTQGLTAQERQIAEMAARGMTNRDIGQHLHMSHRTVGAHLYRIFPKLGITTRAQLLGVLRNSAEAAERGYGT